MVASCCSRTVHRRRPATLVWLQAGRLGCWFGWTDCCLVPYSPSLARGEDVQKRWAKGVAGRYEDTPHESAHDSPVRFVRSE